MNNLAKIRNSKGMSQKEVAEYLGLSRQAYCNYENGKREASYEVLLQLCELFNTTIDELLGRSAAPRSPITDDDIKIALFGGADNITDEMYSEVLRFADYVKNRENKK